MKGKIGAIVLGIVLVLALIIGFACMERVPAGYVGIVYSMNGGVGDEVLSQGFHLVAPTKKVTLYSIGIEQSYLTAGNEGDSKNDDSFEAPSSDGKGLRVDLTFTYRYDIDKVTTTFIRFKGQSGKEILSTFIKPNVISWTKEVTAKYPVTEILGEERANLNIALTEYLASKFSPYGIVIETASLLDINPDEETRQAIQKKVNAQQELELATIEKNTARIQAEKDKEIAEIAAEKDKQVAEINAKKVLIEAQGRADAMKVEAEAQAKANSVIAASLTKELIEQIKYNKWNGVLPYIEGTAMPIIDINGN